MTTMADIAKRAGVSVSTVSYVLSGKRPISEETRQRVLGVIRESNFQPNAAGRALASRRSRTIALLYPVDAFGLTRMPLEFVISAAESAGRLGYALLVSTSSAEDEEILSKVERGAVDGVIVMEVVLHDPRVDLLRERGVPFTMIGHCADTTGLSYVDLDFPQAVEAAVAHLHDLGHRQIALVDRTTDESAFGYGPSVRSRAGFRESTAARAGLRGIHAPCAATAADGARVARELLTSHPELTAIISLNTEALGGICSSVRELGLSIPDDLSIVAITSPRIAEFMVPQVTSVDFPAALMGRMGVEFLVRHLEGGEDTPIEPCLLQTTITVRQSTGPAPSR
jgi:DNA-binding LacI/PurR family transcriptional regulator